MGSKMGSKNETVDTLLARQRLVDLKQRLARLSASWTVDNYESLIEFHVRILPQLFAAERCTVYVIKMGSDAIYSMYGTGLGDKRIEPPREGSVAGRVISSGRGEVANHLDTRAGFHATVADKTGFVTRNMICSPIRSVVSHQVTGAVQMLNRREGDFSGADLTMLDEVAGYLSLSMESIVLNREIMHLSGQFNREVERVDREFFLDTRFIAESAAMRDVIEMVRMVSNLPINVLIQGDNGTGKELIARLLHKASDRRDGPFVAVNCASIPENLMESEFFGYDKGAFTGASQSRLGRFEEATGGTLMLDEVADMPLSVQPKFLRAIQEWEGSRLGSNRLIPYNFRLISASNKDLKQQLRQGTFREDLFFRLFSVEIRLPPLRQRHEDIVPLTLAFLDETCRRFNRPLAPVSPAVLNIFTAYDWPGNVRQLRGEVERLVALTAPGAMITPDKCSADLLARVSNSGYDPSAEATLPEAVKNIEIRLIEKALKDFNGNRLRAAAHLGITRQGLYKKLKRYGIDKSN